MEHTQRWLQDRVAILSEYIEKEKKAIAKLEGVIKIHRRAITEHRKEWAEVKRSIKK